jgi:hypothetical protein
MSKNQKEIIEGLEQMVKLGKSIVLKMKEENKESQFNCYNSIDIINEYLGARGQINQMDILVYPK